MCSLVEGSIMDQPEKKEPISLICKKCKTEKSETPESYCRDCFLLNAIHKFRSTLGKNKGVKHGERVLVGFGGECSKSSVAMLDLLHSGFDDATAKKVKYVPIIITVSEYDSDHLELVRKFGFESHVVSFSESSLDPDQLLLDPELKDSGLNDIVQSSHGSQDFIRHRLRTKILVNVAQKLKCTKIMTGESSTSLAVTLLSGIAGGRGMNLPFDVGFAEDITESLQIIRPMREFSSDEIDRYCTFRGYTFPGEKPASHDEIRKLTEEFALGLQQNFPATIPTIFRTGDKLGILPRNFSESNCLLCSGNLDTDSRQSALRATEFSRFISTHGKLDLPSKEELEKATMIDEQPQQERNSKCCSSVPSRTDIARDLCYGCRIVFDRMERYPNYFISETQRRCRRSEMKNEIKDFLL